MRKYLLLLIIVLLTGCDITYNLEITNDSFNESANFVSVSSDESKEFSDYYINQDYIATKDILNKDFYNKKTINKGDYLGLNVNYSFDYSDYNSSSLLNYCFESNSIQRKNDIIVINAKNSYQCFIPDEYNKIDKIVIKIKTKLKVLKNNADEINNNIYTWNLYRDNSLNKDIYLKLKRTTNHSSFIIVFVIFVFIGIVVYFVYKMIKNKNMASNEI